MKVEYSSNNSGGYWWLKDEDWYALEKAGWEVKWKGERWLGALASRAEKDFPSLKEAIMEFEKVTGQQASDEGCNCCGPPHNCAARRSTSRRRWLSPPLTPSTFQAFEHKRAGGKAARNEVFDPTAVKVASRMRNY